MAELPSHHGLDIMYADRHCGHHLICMYSVGIHFLYVSFDIFFVLPVLKLIHNFQFGGMEFPIRALFRGALEERPCDIPEGTFEWFCFIRTFEPSNVFLRRSKCILQQCPALLHCHMTMLHACFGTNQVIVLCIVNTMLSGVVCIQSILLR